MGSRQTLERCTAAPEVVPLVWWPWPGERRTQGGASSPNVLREMSGMYETELRVALSAQSRAHTEYLAHLFRGKGQAGNVQGSGKCG